MGEPSIDNGGQKGKKLLERAWDALLDAGVDGENARRLVAWMKEYIHVLNLNGDAVKSPVDRFWASALKRRQAGAEGR